MDLWEKERVVSCRFLVDFTPLRKNPGAKNPELDTVQVVVYVTFGNCIYPGVQQLGGPLL